MSTDGKQPTQAMGDKPDAGAGANDTGRSGGGESGGGAFKDPDQVKGDPKATGFMGHGGQSNNAYSGPGDADDGGENDNDPAS